MIEGATDLGDSWKVVGAATELGGWDPAVAPPAWWREGGKWEAEVPVPPGNHVFKAILRKADGQYIYEPGNDRVIQVRIGWAGRRGGKVEEAAGLVASSRGTGGTGAGTGRQQKEEKMGVS